MLFKDRTTVGQLLAGQLFDYANRFNVLVLALSRGGVRSIQQGQPVKIEQLDYHQHSTQRSTTDQAIERPPNLEKPDLIDAASPSGGKL